MNHQNAKIKQTAKERELETSGAKMFGKQVSREKARALLVITMAACALPMILGARLWNEIPDLVSSGLIGMNGKDDALPRWMVAFGLPGFICLMNLIAHVQLRGNQKRKTLPPPAVRLVGRWGFPIISVVFCSGMILQSAGEALTLQFITPCILGIVLLLLGAHIWDCPKDSKIALRFSFTQSSPAAWDAVHRLAGWLWMTVGLMVIGGVMLTSSSTPYTAALVLVAMMAPIIYGYRRGKTGCI